MLFVSFDKGNRFTFKDLKMGINKNLSSEFLFLKVFMVKSHVDLQQHCKIVTQQSKIHLVHNMQVPLDRLNHGHALRK